MIRGYALVVMNSQDQITDRFNLDLVTAPTGNGFQLELSTIATDIEDVITKVVQKKATINMTVHQVTNGYMQSNVLTNWIQKYSTADTNMFLEYNDTKTIKYCGGKVTSLTKTEKDEYKDLAQDLTFTMTTPFFTKQSSGIIKIAVSNKGKSYPFKYPYSYGRNIIENTTITNPYILEVPLIISITGEISDPIVSLFDESGERYNMVDFTGTTLTSSERIVINSAIKKIYKVDIDANGNEIAGTEVDYRPEVNPEHDTYLFAKKGTSIITLNIDDTGTLEGTWRQYTL